MSYELALSKFTRHTQRIHELFMTAAQYAISDHIYIECSESGFSTLVFETDPFSENIFIMIPRYSKEQMKYIAEHAACVPQEVPGFAQKVEYMHKHLQIALNERAKDAISDSQPTTLPKGKETTRGELYFRSAITSGRLIQ